MECGRAFLLLCLAFALVSAEGRSFGRKDHLIQKLKDPSDDDWDRPWDSSSADSSVAAIQMHHHQEVSQQRISPELEPKSNKKFFKKDYPSDTRPGVDVLHFKHPYPVVQDSGEFDDDYVKDENTDNGHWKAQQEYDRLRHKLKKEKKEAENALAKRTKQEQELKEAMEKYDKEVKNNKDKAEAAKKKAEEEKRSADAAKKEKEEPEEQSKSKGSSWSWNWWPFSWPKWDTPEDKPAPKKEVHQEQSGVDAATDDTEKAMDNLENCKKELETARKQLKELMDELEKAKAKQANADEAAASAAKKQAIAEKTSSTLHEKTTSEETEYKSAKESYEKQQARVAKLQAELDVAAAKVKKYRDAEDKDGGVYNTPEEPKKSFAASISSTQVLVTVLLAFITRQSM